MDVLVNPYAHDLVRARLSTLAPPNKIAQQFAVGQTLTGRLLRVVPGEGTLVNFHGQPVLLNLTLKMAKGQTLTATVEQVSPHFVLRLVGGSAQLARAYVIPSNALLEQADSTTDDATAGLLDAAALKSYLAAKQPFGEMVSALANLLSNHPLLRALDPTLRQRLQDTLAVLLPRNASLPDASGLQEQVVRSGINYEAQVTHVLRNDLLSAEQTKLAHDFKGQLLELTTQLEHLVATGSKALAKEAEGLLQQVRRGLQTIELQQLTNLVAHEERQPLLLQLTHPLFAAAQTAQLYVRNNATGHRGQDAQHQDYTLVLLLDFTTLGPLRVDATVRDTQVTATLSVTEPAVADFITSQLADLTARLHDRGFQAHVTCRVQTNVSMDVDDNLTRLLLPDSSRLVDIRA
jgi:hypothetical protein